MTDTPISAVELPSSVIVIFNLLSLPIVLLAWSLSSDGWPSLGQFVVVPLFNLTALSGMSFHLTNLDYFVLVQQKKSK